MQQTSRIIISNQQSIHPELDCVVKKHLKSSFQKPISDFNQQAFAIADQLYQQHSGTFILDSGCGVGESTFHIANQYPDALVIGVDQSEHRINCNNDWQLPPNAHLIRADLIDFWRLAAKAGWQLSYHFILYPNPWPKKKHLQRRWHGHPVFPVLSQLGGQIELRTNWQIYAAEFAQAFTIVSNMASKKNYTINPYTTDTIMTPFERKYLQSKQPLFQVIIST